MNRLELFVAAAHERVADGVYDTEGTALPTNGSLLAALQDHPTPVIAELKPASPSEGRLLQEPAKQRLQGFLEGGAAAISCLTDRDFFDGSPSLVREAHSTGLPVLWKDFVVDSQQVEAAAHHGASAILLIERILQPSMREKLVDQARAAGLEVLLEVFDEADWQTAQQSAATMIGVNARNLDDLTIDSAAALDLLTKIAPTKPVVALSGIANRVDRRRAMAAGATAVLVGTTLMQAPDARLTLRGLQRPVAKVCGLQSGEELQTAADADIVGFVVGAPNSPRNLTPVAAQSLNDEAHSYGLRTALVTPHEDAWEVREWCRLVRPDYVQLDRLRPDEAWLHSLKNIPTIALHVVHDGEQIPDGPFVLDNSGGTGQEHQWPRGAARSRHFSLVAGGLDASNASNMIAWVEATGGDASSKLESSPGVKDQELVQAFVEACHNG